MKKEKRGRSISSPNPHYALELFNDFSAAVVSKDFSKIDSILQNQHFDVNLQESQEGETLLHICTTLDKVEIVNKLLKHGAQTERSNIRGETPLIIAACNGSLDICMTLTKYHANPNHADTGGLTALHWAVIRGNTQVVKLLLNSGANINCRDQGGNTPLHLSALYEYTDITKLLLKYNAEVNVKTINQTTPLHHACERGNTAITHVLLHSQCGDMVNEQDDSGFTCLHYAVKSGNISLVKLLLENGADETIQSYEGKIPVKYSSCSEMKRIFFPELEDDWVIVDPPSEEKTELTLSGSLPSPPRIENSFSNRVKDDEPNHLREKKLSIIDLSDLKFTEKKHLSDSDEQPPYFQPNSAPLTPIPAYPSPSRSNDVFAELRAIGKEDLTSSSVSLPIIRSATHIGDLSLSASADSDLFRAAFSPFSYESLSPRNKTSSNSDTHKAIHSVSTSSVKSRSNSVSSDNNSVYKSNASKAKNNSNSQGYTYDRTKNRSLDNHTSNSITKLKEFLDSIGLIKYLGKFIDEEWDWDSLLEITNEDLIEMDIKAGSRRKILNAIQRIKSPMRNDCFFRSSDKAIPIARTVRESWDIDFNSLELSSFLGNGFYGSVYKGTWNTVDVAIKKLTKLEHFDFDKWMMEVRLLLELRHPNIVTCYCACTTYPNYCIVLEYLSRGSLSRVLRDKLIPIDHKKRLSFAIDCAKGMNYLHDRTPPIIHRDLKSDNLLVTDDWRVKVSDFGLSRLKDYRYTYTQPTSPFDVTITSPEVLIHNHISEKADVYSFGLLMWELYTRTRPFEGMNPHWVAQSVINDELRPTIDESWSPSYVSLMKQCWAQDYTKRPTFKEILLQLESQYKCETDPKVVEILPSLGYV